MTRLLPSVLVALAIVGLSFGLPAQDGKQPVKAPSQAPAPADVQLSLRGDTKIVKVDKVIVTKVDVTVVNSFPVTISADSTSSLFFWTYPGSVEATDQGNVLLVTSAPKGDLTIGVKAIAPNLDKDGKFIGFITSIGRISFSVGDVAPPIPPKPPDPPPPVVSKLRVLVVSDKSNVASLSKAQQDIIALPKDLRAYLDSHCGIVAGVPEYRFLDISNDVTNESAAWQDGFAKTQGKVTATMPWVVIANETSSYDGALPADKAAFLALLKKYGGE